MNTTPVDREISAFTPTVQPEPFTLQTADGYGLKGFRWRHAGRTHLRISPHSIFEPEIGHFGFFKSRFEQKLWQVPLEWLKSGRIPAGFPGVLIRRDQRSAADPQEPTQPVPETSSLNLTATKCVQAR